MSAQLWWLLISRYQFFCSGLPDPGRPILARIEMQQQRQPFAPAVHHKIAKTDIERHTAGMGTSSLISPATMIGTEQIMVTKMVKAILSGSVIAASNLDIVSLFRKLG
ncbi:hypothetical protein LOF13_16160 [Klebsiella pneumoniae subsp. pneumoniae]|nr:hypothetical protein LOF13_16160 [Klebsiella pneumoniae subsp. pneumoniae]